MKGDCLTCTKLPKCPSDVSVELVIQGFSCALYEAASEPIYEARSSVMETFGYVSGIEASMGVLPETEEDFRKRRIELSELLNVVYPVPPGTTYSQRKKHFDEAVFNSIRLLATKTYKLPNGEPLIKYVDAAQMQRSQVKEITLAHEIATGAILDDRNGDTPPWEPPAAQPQAVIAAPVAPVAVPVVTFQPEQSKEVQMPQATMTPGFVPAEQASPPPESTNGTTKKMLRPKAIAAPPSGAPIIEQPQMMPVQQATMSPVIPSPPAGASVMQPQQQMTMQPVFAPPVAAPQGGVSPDVATNNELAKKLDELTSTVSKLSQQLASSQNDFKQLVANLSQQANEDRKLALQLISMNQSLFAALHHVYVNVPGLWDRATKAGGKIETLDGFGAYLQGFIGNPR